MRPRVARTITVPVIDRGPYSHGADWDLTERTARRLRFSGSDTIVMYTYAGDSNFDGLVDGADYGACSSPKQYTGLAVGDHTLSVVATDAAGNIATADGMQTTAGSLALIGAKEAGISVAFAFHSDSALVLADRTQIQQVCMNLMRNAVEAMRDRTVPDAPPISTP